jgi:chromosome segregation ATPase
MEDGQIEKRLDWLDEQRKKDVEQYQRMQVRMKDLEGSIDSLSRRLEELTVEVSKLSATASRIAQFDEALSKHRAEVSRQLEESEERRTRKENQLESLRKSDQKKIAKSVEEIRGELRRFDAIEEQLEQRGAEDIRLNRKLGALEEEIKESASKVNDQLMRLVSLEESSVQESKRINEIQGEIAIINRRIEDLRNLTDTVEDHTRKIDVSLSELKSNDKERSNQLEVWMDEQRMKLVDFEKQWSGWEQHLDAFEKEAREIVEKIQAYDQTHRSIKQMQGQLEGLLERLERRITEVGEMQRLSEERMKQDWAAFEADETKKWSTFKLSTDENWKEHQRVHEKVSSALEELKDLRSGIREDLDALAEREARKVNEIVALTREWLKDQE